MKIRMTSFAGLLLSAFILAGPMVGCSADTTTVRTETVESDPYARGSYDGRPTTTTTTVKTEDHDDDDGHGLFSILGDIIALPFRALAAIF